MVKKGMDLEIFRKQHKPIIVKTNFLDAFLFNRWIGFFSLKRNLPPMMSLICLAALRYGSGEQIRLAKKS